MLNLSDIAHHALPYEGLLELRAAQDIDTIVLHCTELPDLSTAREFGEQIHYPNSGTGNSGHYYIDRDGSTHCWVNPLRVAHHCRGWNARSIGIELVNIGRYPHWLDSRHQAVNAPYPAVQMDALVELLNALRGSFPTISRIAGHEDLDIETVPASNDATVQVRRKLDPGPLFDWDMLLTRVRLERILNA